MITSSQKRVFRANGVHGHSSRSHHVFQIKVIRIEADNKNSESLLNIVDLAGSERRSSLFNDDVLQGETSSFILKQSNQFKSTFKSSKNSFVEVKQETQKHQPRHQRTGSQLQD